MDVWLAITSRRDHRDFAPTPVPDAMLDRILDAGRLSGSARNRQPWRFHVATEVDARSRLAECVYVPGMIMAAPLAIGMSVEAAGSALSGFDAGRAAQSMMLAAWGEGIASCPNGVAHPALAAAVLGIEGTRIPVTILAFGFPRSPIDPARRTPAEWSRRAHRAQLARLVETVGGSAREA